jgi:hypothetical protein
MAMRSIRTARIVVAADGVSGRSLLHLLTRMDIPQVRLVASTAEARSLFEAGEADACLVAVRNFQIEDAPARSVEEPAPSPSAILLADVVTPYVARTARRSGYAAVAALSIAPRLLYRRIGGALQKARRTQPSEQARGRRRIGLRLAKGATKRAEFPGIWPDRVGSDGKIKLSS